jgi:hypothetical protein
MKRRDKRAIALGTISAVVGYFLASLTFYVSKLYLIDDKNPLAFLYILLMFVFAVMFYLKNFKDFVYAKKEKKLKSEDINMDWTK